MPQRKRYTKQFKDEALRLVSQEGVILSQVAQDLGLDASMLRRWRKEVGIQGPAAFRGHGYAHDEELAKLKRELGALELEKAPDNTFIGRIAKDGLPCPARFITR